MWSDEGLPSLFAVPGGATEESFQSLKQVCEKVCERVGRISLTLQRSWRGKSDYHMFYSSEPRISDHVSWLLLWPRLGTLVVCKNVLALVFCRFPYLSVGRIVDPLVLDEVVERYHSILGQLEPLIHHGVWKSSFGFWSIRNVEHKSHIWGLRKLPISRQRKTWRMCSWIRLRPLNESLQRSKEVYRGSWKP